MSSLAGIVSLAPIHKPSPVGGGPPPETQTFDQWLASTNGGNGPTRYWPMDDASGTVMAATIGGINGTWVNPEEITFEITDADAQKWVGFNWIEANGHGRIVTPLQSSAFTAMAICQFDIVEAKHVIITTGLGGLAPGQFSFEVVDDGANGLKGRCISVNASSEAVILVGANAGTVPVGKWCALFYVRPNDGTQEFWVVSAAGVQKLTLILDAGTPPLSWLSHPAATWFVGTGADPMNGCMRSLALWDVALPVSNINALALISPQIQNVVWARPAAFGLVQGDTIVEDLDIRRYVHPEFGFTTAITQQGTLGTWSVDGVSEHFLDYDAGAVGGTDTAGRYQITRDDDSQQSPVASLTIEVETALPSTLPEDEPLPAADVTVACTTANFAANYAAASLAPGVCTHLVLANGSYGLVVLDRNKAGVTAYGQGKPIVIRAANLLGATFSRIEMNGTGHIVSGVLINNGHMAFGASMSRFTRSKVVGTASTYTTARIDGGVTDVMIDHCDISLFGEWGVWIQAPRDQKRIIASRNWLHEPADRPQSGFYFGWQDTNAPQENRIDSIVRLNYLGPHVISGSNDSYLHNKISAVIYACNKMDPSGGGDRLFNNRAGVDIHFVGNYGTDQRIYLRDIRGWAFGNRCESIWIPGGNTYGFDETKNSTYWNGVNGQSNRHAALQSRTAGNQVTGTITVGVWFEDFCSNQPLAAGANKPQATVNGVVYAAVAGGGIPIRAHSGGSLVTREASEFSCAFTPYSGLDYQPSAAAPSAWRTDLFAKYPWLQTIIPDPTSLSGGPNGSAPWSIAQALTRGDAANPNTGPNRNSPGGLP